MRYTYRVGGLAPSQEYRLDTRQDEASPAAVWAPGSGREVDGASVTSDYLGRMDAFESTRPLLYAKPVALNGATGVPVRVEPIRSPLPLPVSAATAPALALTHDDPPTIVLSEANAATAIVGGADRAASLPAFRYAGTRMVPVPSATVGGYEGALTSWPITTQFPPHQWQVEFTTDADEIELVWQCVTTSVAGTRVWVDGVPAEAPDTAIGTGGAIYRTSVTFGGRALRTVRFEAVWARFIGVTCHPTVSIQPPPAVPRPVCVVLGDSFAEGTGGTWSWTGWPAWMGSCLGWDVHQLGVGGTGYVNDGDTEGKTALAGRLGDVHPDADVVVVAAGYNDDQQATADVTAAARDLYGRLAADWPGVPVVVVSNWTSEGVTSAGAATAVRDALLAEAVRAGFPFVDAVGYPDRGSWITGTGEVGDTEGDGNADYYISGDGIHPSAAGHEFLGRTVAAHILDSTR